LAKTDKIKILYIDDEPNNLVGFKASFRFDYNVFVAVNTTEARTTLNNNPDIRVILCDQRMPDQTGVQFFEEIRSVHPDPIRMLLTGYADIESVIDAINRGNIFRYIKKPWTDADIQTAIDEANKFYITNTMLTVKNVELQNAYNELDKFAYSVTHDMRGPLLSILGAIDLSKESNSIDEIKEILSMMKKSVLGLDDFIKSMNEYYNLKRGELQIVEINFANIVKELEESFDDAREEYNVNLDINVVQNETFRCDEMLLKVILSNLLSNAFKFQQKNNNDKRIVLNIEVNKGTAAISVKDNGIGIHEDHISKIFSMFYKAIDNPGSGIGLYNVKDALKRLNGEINVSSRPDEGTTFQITIPSK
jgi:two-component system, sensor histidine kinase and response regulator